MDLVALGQEQLGEVGAVLPVHARYECLLHLVSSFVSRAWTLVADEPGSAARRTPPSTSVATHLHRRSARRLQLHGIAPGPADEDRTLLERSRWVQGVGCEGVTNAGWTDKQTRQRVRLPH